MSSVVEKIRDSQYFYGSSSLFDDNPILEFFEVGKHVSTAGPDFVWDIYDAKRKYDSMECSVFFFDKQNANKMFRPKKSDCVLNRIRRGITLLTTQKCSKMLEVIHPLEETANTIAFASESVFASLHHILAWQDSTPLRLGNLIPVLPRPTDLSQSDDEEPKFRQPTSRPAFARKYQFEDIELRYGLLQVIEALQYLHCNQRQCHRNLCPQNIIVTKRSVWKIFGLDFMQPLDPDHPSAMLEVPPWSIRMTKACQPTLDFLAPEVQRYGQCHLSSDIFSFGLIICAIYNNGKYLLQSNNNPLLYLKQIQNLDAQVLTLLPRMPESLQEAVRRMVSRELTARPTTQLIPLLQYFNNPGDRSIQAMQFLDSIRETEPDLKCAFYRVELINVLPLIPQKIRWQLVWPVLEREVMESEIISSALQPIFWLMNNSSSVEFHNYILPLLRHVMRENRSVKGKITILENVHILFNRFKHEDALNDILQFIYDTMDSTINHVQSAALVTLESLLDDISDIILRENIITRFKGIIEKNNDDVDIINMVLGIFEKCIDRLERGQIMEVILPTLLVMRLNNPDVLHRVVELYKIMLTEKRFGINNNIMATQMLPSLTSQTVNPAINIDQFTNLMTVIYDMLENIDYNQRFILEAKAAKTSQANREKRSFFSRLSSDKTITAPPFTIPSLQVNQSKTSSTENTEHNKANPIPSTSTSTPTATTEIAAKPAAFPSAAKPATVSAAAITAPVATDDTEMTTSSVSATVEALKNTGIGQWLFGSNTSETKKNSGSNFLRVNNPLPNRRSSDNTLMTPKVRIAPSCSSSPGGTPGGAAGLPSRRHSSIGPQDRRRSGVALSPPITRYPRAGRGSSGSSLSVPFTSQRPGGSMPNSTTGSRSQVMSSTHSVRSRRTSMGHTEPQGSGIFQQISSGVVRRLSVGRNQNPQMPQPWTVLQESLTALRQTVTDKTYPSINVKLH